MPETKWDFLAKGIHVLKLWDTIGPLSPQIAVLRLSGTEYKKFLKDPTKYFNEHKVFGKTPTHKVDVFQVGPPIKKILPGTEYIVVGHHEFTTTTSATVSALEKW